MFKKVCGRYQHLSEEKRNKKCQYAFEQYKNLSEEEKNKKQMYLCQQYEFFSEEGKQRLAEYGKNYSRMQEKID